MIAPLNAILPLFTIRKTTKRSCSRIRSDVRKPSAWTSWCVHGEAERNDMVEYFGEQLQGFAFINNGWVQSYGSRCVKPPIICGDVRRPRPMTVLSAFENQAYPQEVGPGVYDIHSPRVPSKEEMVDLLHRTLQVVLRERLWVNPDCGLQTRNWTEVEPSLTNMVRAARVVRRELQEAAS